MLPRFGPRDQRYSLERRLCTAGLLLALLPSATALAASAVKLTPAQEQALGVRTAALSPGDAAPLATLPGLFVRPPSSRAAVSAPLAGSVNQVNVVEGQAVRAGQVLATVFSREALSETAGLGQARAEATVAAATAARTRKLAEEGIIAGARAAEAEARAQAARAMLAAKSASVRAAGAGASGVYALRAPFSGRVVDVQVTAGQGVDAMSLAFVVDRDDRIQVDATAPAAFAGRILPGSRAIVEGVQGRVVAVGAEIDPRSRSLSVRVEVPPRPAFIPGRATRAQIFGAAGATALSAPRGAVTTVGGRNVVFVRTPGGFVVTPVTVQGYSGDRVMLTGALPAGAAVAVSGVSELKAQAAN